MLESTKGMRKMFGKEKNSMGNLLEGYIYSKWINWYIYYVRAFMQKVFPDPNVIIQQPQEIISPEIEELTQLAVENMISKSMSSETNVYHSKVVKLDDARALLTINENVELTNLERVIPYKHARDIILKNPDQIAVIDCACRTTKKNPCKPLDVCLIVGEPFVSFFLDHNKENNPRKISQEEAVTIVKAEDDRGHLHTAWFKDACGDRFFAICNCCKCCCTPMTGHFNGVPMIASSGYICEINEECNECGNCVEYCQFGALNMNGKAVVNVEKCMGCGVCESKCPVEAISMKRNPAKSEPLDIRVLMSQQQAS